MSFRRAVFLGGTVVATLDGLDAIVFQWLRGTSPATVFQFVASGLIGPAAYRGGLATVLLGVGLHVLIAGAVVAVLCYVHARSGLLDRGWPWIGAAYGLLVFAVMNWLVIPLSLAASPAADTARLLNGIGIHLFGVGLPAAWFARSVNRRATNESMAELLSSWGDAIVANDPEAIDWFAEPDWVLLGEKGILPRERFLEAVRVGRVTHDMMTFEVHEVRQYGDVAVVIARAQNSGTFNGERFVFDEWTTDIFIRRPGGWKCSVTQLTTAVAETPE